LNPTEGFYAGEAAAGSGDGLVVQYIRAPLNDAKNFLTAMRASIWIDDFVFGLMRAVMILLDPLDAFLVTFGTSPTVRPMLLHVGSEVASLKRITAGCTPDLSRTP
jgi:hypothetical protein